MSLETLLQQNTSDEAFSKPAIFDLSNTEDQKQLELLFEQEKIKHVIDEYKQSLRDYFEVVNPPLVFQPGFEEHFNAYLDEQIQEKPLFKQGRWVFYPWISTIVHILEEQQFFTVRTSRNKNLISTESQELFYNATVGIAGLSVGSSIACALALQGGAKRLRLADGDQLSLSNTNRVLANITSLGTPKTVMTARMIYLINPYAEIELMSEGLNESNIETFFESAPKLDFVIDEIDDIAMKSLLRKNAKRLNIPLIMGADNANGVIIDIEQYDKDPDLNMFDGRLGDATFETLSKLDKMGTGKMIVQLLGQENIAPGMFQSLSELGKTIVSWPQLGGTVLLNAAAVTYFVRKIISKEVVTQKRVIISFDNLP